MSKYKNKKNKKIKNIENKTELKKENTQTQNNNLIWEIDDMVKHSRSKRWYIIASIIALALITWAVIDKNYLFALIIILISALIVFYDSEQSQKIKVELKYNGIFLGNSFFKFENISKFYIIYKPEEEIKKLFFEFKNPLKHRLSIPIDKENPIIIRNYLLQFLEEDLEKEDEPFSDAMSKILKI